MNPEKPLRIRNEQLFAAAASDQTLIGGLTVLRLVPSTFETTLRFVRNAKGKEPATIFLAPSNAKEKIMSYWADHRQLPMTDRLEFMLGDIAQLARMSGESEQATTLQLSFHNISDKSGPFMPHAGLRLIYDVLPADDSSWGMAQLTEAIQPKLGDLALYIDIVATEVTHERLADSSERRDAFVAQLERYKSELSHKKYPGASETTPEYQAHILDINWSLLSKDPEGQDEGKSWLTPTIYVVGEDDGGAIEHAEGHEPAHVPAGIEAGHGQAAQGSVMTHGAEALALHHILETRKEEEKRKVEILHQEHLKREVQEHLNEENRKADEAALEKQHDLDMDARMLVNENEEAVRVRADELREEQQIAADELREEQAMLGEGGAEEIRENDLEGEERLREYDLTGERIETLQDEGAEEQTAYEQRTQGVLEQESRIYAEGRENEEGELRNEEDEVVEEERVEGEVSPEAEGGESAEALVASETNELPEVAEQPETAGATEAAEVAETVELEREEGGAEGEQGGGENNAVDEDEDRVRTGELSVELQAQAAEAANEMRAQANEMFAKRNEELGERSTELAQEKASEDAADQNEAAVRVREDIDETQALAAEDRAETIKRADEVAGENNKALAELQQEASKRENEASRENEPDEESDLAGEEKNENERGPEDGKSEDPENREGSRIDARDAETPESARDITETERSDDQNDSRVSEREVEPRGPESGEGRDENRLEARESENTEPEGRHENEVGTVGDASEGAQTREEQARDDVREADVRETSEGGSAERDGVQESHDPMQELDGADVRSERSGPDEQTRGESLDSQNRDQDNQNDQGAGFEHLHHFHELDHEYSDGQGHSDAGTVSHTGHDASAASTIIHTHGGTAAGPYQELHQAHVASLDHAMPGSRFEHADAHATSTLNHASAAPQHTDLTASASSSPAFGHGIKEQGIGFTHPAHILASPAPAAGSHQVSAHQVLEDFHRAANIDTHAVNTWQPLGHGQFTLANFRALPTSGPGTISLGHLSAAQWPGATQPKLDIVDRITRSLISNHLRSPRKAIVVKSPNLNHTFADMLALAQAPTVDAAAVPTLEVS